jgi:hypothetical protein
MLHKINILFLIGLFSLGSLYAQQNEVKLTDHQLDGYKTQCHQMMDYLQGTLNFLGDPSNPPAEKEIIINSSYLKVFQNDKVQIEGDLDGHRLVPIHKDVQAYLKDVVFFFKKVTFTFHINSIEALSKPNGQLFFKITMNRNLQGVTVNNDTVDNNLLRYVEINLDPEQNSLKIASIYTHKPNDDAEIQYWWNHLSSAWRNYFGAHILVYDSVPLNKVLYFSPDTLVVARVKLPVSDSLPADTIQKTLPDSLLPNTDSLMPTPDTLIVPNSRLMLQLVRHLRDAREIDISGNLEIENLQPVKEMDNLRVLNCAHTLIDDLTPLRSLSHLQKLDITGCPVGSLEPLRYVSALREIDAAYTSVKKVNVLASLKNLERVNLSHTAVDTLPRLENLKKLQILEMNATLLQSLDSLRSMPGLSNLSLARCPAKDFSALSTLTGLQNLNLDSTFIVDLQPLSHLDSLTILQINGTKVSNLLPLAKLPALRYIYCDNSKVHFKEAEAFHQQNPSCQVIYNSQKLEKWWHALPKAWKSIFVSHAHLQPPVSKEQLHQLLSLKKLDLEGNTEIHSLKPLEMLIQLRDLNISGTAVQDITPLGAVRTLETLNISHTRVASLSPLQSLKNLRTVNLENTMVGDITPLAGNRSLKLVLADGTRVKQKNAWALQQILPQCLVLFQTPQLTLWWNNLSKPWQEAFAQQAELDQPPTAEQLQQLVNRQKLNITRHLDIESVEPLTVFTHLQSLKLDNTGVADISPLAGLKYLQELTVSNSPLWDISPLSRMKSLLSLNLENTSVEDLFALQPLRSLRILNISGTRVKNLKPLAGLRQLQKLFINNTRVNSLKYISPLTRLKLLRCDHTLLREKKVDAFRQKHPHTKVIFY